MANARFRSFVFGETLYKMLKELPDDIQLKYCLHIMEYGLYGVEPELAGVERMAWISIKTLIDNLSRRPGAPAGNRNAVKDKTAGGDNGDKALPPPAATDDGSGSGGAQTPETGGGDKAPEGENKENNPNQLKTTQNNSDELNSIENNKNKENNPLYIYDSKFKIHDSGLQDSALRNLSSREENSEKATSPPEKTPSRDFYPPEDSPGGNSLPEESAKAGGNPPFPEKNAYEIIRAAWNSRQYGAFLPECRLLEVNLDIRRRDILARTLAQYSVSDIVNAIKNYMWMQVNREKVNICPCFSDMFNFLDKAVQSFFEDPVFNSTYLKTEGA